MELVGSDLEDLAKQKLVADLLRGKGQVSPRVNNAVAGGQVINAATAVPAAPRPSAAQVVPESAQGGWADVNPLVASLQKEIKAPLDMTQVEAANAARRRGAQRDLGVGLNLALRGDESMASAGGKVLEHALENAKPLRMNAADVGYEGPEGMVMNPQYSKNERIKATEHILDKAITFNEKMAETARKTGDNDQLTRIKEELIRLQGVQSAIRTQAIDVAAAKGQGGDSLTNKQRDLVSSHDAQIKTVEGALAAAEKAPSAFGMMRGLAPMVGGRLGESIAGRKDTEAEAYARARVFNEISSLIKERAGTAQSAQELSRITSFMPADTDNFTEVKRKLGSFKDYLAEKRDAINVVVPKYPTAAPPKDRRAPISPEREAELKKKYGG